MISANPDTLSEEYEIKSLLARERYYRDTGQWENLRDCYHPDASKTKIDISWCTGNIDDFVSGSKTMAEKGVRGIHNISPVLVHFQGDKAVSESVGSILTPFDVDGASYELSACLTFVSRLQNTDRGWRLLTFEAIYDYDKITSVVPWETSRLDVSADDARKSYRCMSWLLSARGYQISQTLPGRDRPDLVDEFMKAHLEWLRE